MNINLSILLKDSLLLAGCSEKIMDNFDDNSTIMLEFHDYPNLYLYHDRDNNHVLMWSPICEANTSILSTYAYPILQLLLKPVNYAYCGQNILTEMNGNFAIKCIVDEKYLTEPAVFLNALSEYFDFISECIEAIK